MFLLCNNDIKLNRGFYYGKRVNCKRLLYIQFSNVEKVTQQKSQRGFANFMLALELQEYATVCENSLPNRAFTGAEIKAPISLNFNRRRSLCL